MMGKEDRATILIVDDTPENIAVLDDLLSSDYQLRPALNGEKALTIANSADNRPDLILLDIMMPGMDGFEVIKILKGEPTTRDIPVIFLTAMTGAEDEEKGLKLGAVDYITKPFAPSLVRARIKTHLALKEASDRLAEQNEALKEAARLKEDVERIARHDMKTPITGVIAIPDIILAGDNLTDEQKEGLSVIRESGYQLLHMVSMSLDLYKMEQGTYRFQPTPVDLVPLVSRILAGLANLIEAAGLTVNTEPADSMKDGFYVSGSETLLYSLLANIIKNAVEASPENGTITITFSQDNGMGAMAIHNAGAIPEEIRERFFEKYATHGKERGTGLGAYSARLIATTMGGAVRHETSEETGTTITVSIPSSAPPSLPSAIQEERVFHPVKPARGIKLSDLRYLVVDDMPNIRMIVKEALRGLGVAKVEVAINGKKAIESLGRSPADVVISDWNMPIMTGLELLQWVRNSPDFAKTPFIMLTAEATEENVISAVQSGVSGYVIKPFTPRTLVEKLKEILL